MKRSLLDEDIRSKRAHLPEDERNSNHGRLGSPSAWSALPAVGSDAANVVPRDRIPMRPRRPSLSWPQGALGEDIGTPHPARRYSSTGLQVFLNGIFPELMGTVWGPVVHPEGVVGPPAGCLWAAGSLPLGRTPLFHDQPANTPWPGFFPAHTPPGPCSQPARSPPFRYARGSLGERAPTGVPARGWPGRRRLPARHRRAEIPRGGGASSARCGLVFE